VASRSQLKNIYTQNFTEIRPVRAETSVRTDRRNKRDKASSPFRNPFAKAPRMENYIIKIHLLHKNVCLAYQITLEVFSNRRQFGSASIVTLEQS